MLIRQWDNALSHLSITNLKSFVITFPYIKHCKLRKIDNYKEGYSFFFQQIVFFLFHMVEQYLYHRCVFFAMTWHNCGKKDV